MAERDMTTQDYREHSDAFDSLSIAVVGGKIAMNFGPPIREDGKLLPCGENAAGRVGMVVSMGQALALQKALGLGIQRLHIFRQEEDRRHWDETHRATL
jgi:hypothetical protein